MGWREIWEVCLGSGLGWTVCKVNGVCYPEKGKMESGLALVKRILLLFVIALALFLFFGMPFAPPQPFLSSDSIGVKYCLAVSSRS